MEIFEHPYYDEPVVILETTQYGLGDIILELDQESTLDPAIKESRDSKWPIIKNANNAFEGFLLRREGSSKEMDKYYIKTSPLLYSYHNIGRGLDLPEGMESMIFHPNPETVNYCAIIKDKAGNDYLLASLWNPKYADQHKIAFPGTFIKRIVNPMPEGMDEEDYYHSVVGKPEGVESALLRAIGEYEFKDGKKINDLSGSKLLCEIYAENHDTCLIFMGRIDNYTIEDLSGLDPQYSQKSLIPCNIDTFDRILETGMYLGNPVAGHMLGGIRTLRDNMSLLG